MQAIPRVYAEQHTIPESSVNGVVQIPLKAKLPYPYFYSFAKYYESYLNPNRDGWSIR